MRTTPGYHALLRAVRRAVTLACLAPLLAVLALAAPHLPRRELLYPYAVVAGTAALLYLAYGRYADPARYPAHRATSAAADRNDAGDAGDAGDFPELPAVPTVTVLTSVRDGGPGGGAGVAAVVRALAATDHPALEVIVVDDGCTGATAAELDRLAAELPVAVLRLDRPVGHRRALLHGAGHATGDLLAFVDDGCLLAPDAVRRCVAVLAGHPDVGAVGGGRSGAGATAAASFGAVDDLAGGLAVYRRDAVYPYLPAWRPGRPLAALVLGQVWVGARLRSRYADSPFTWGAAQPPRRWRVGYARSARAHPPAGGSPVHPLRRAAARVRAAGFTGRFAWRLGPAPATLYYLRLLALLTAPPAAAWHLLWEPAQGRWAPAVAYLVAAALSGTAYAIAAGVGGAGGRRLPAPGYGRE